MRLLSYVLLALGFLADVLAGMFFEQSTGLKAIFCLLRGRDLLKFLSSSSICRRYLLISLPIQKGLMECCEGS